MRYVVVWRGKRRRATDAQPNQVYYGAADRRGGMWDIAPRICGEVLGHMPEAD